MITDAERRWARAEAKRRFDNHCRHPTYDRYGGVTAFDRQEGYYRSLLCEIAFANRFGLKVDGELREYGDGGKDFDLPLQLRDRVHTFVVNVKATTVKYSWEGLQATTFLRVPVNECRRYTIYVFGIYLLTDDDAEVLRWQWGGALLDRNDIRQFDKVNYVYPYTELRELEELERRRVDTLSHQEVPRNPGFGLSDR